MDKLKLRGLNETNYIGILHDFFDEKHIDNAIELFDVAMEQGFKKAIDGLELFMKEGFYPKLKDRKIVIVEKGNKEEEKDLKIDKFRGETIYSDIRANTIIRQGYMREVELIEYNKGGNNIIVLSNRLAVENMVKELQRILKNWA